MAVCDLLSLSLGLVTEVPAPSASFYGEYIYISPVCATSLQAVSELLFALREHLRFNSSARVTFSDAAVSCTACCL